MKYLLNAPPQIVHRSTVYKPEGGHDWKEDGTSPMEAEASSDRGKGMLSH